MGSKFAFVPGIGTLYVGQSKAATINCNCNGEKAKTTIIVGRQETNGAERSVVFHRVAGVQPSVGQSGVERRRGFIALQLTIMAKPQGAPRVRNSGGLRKLRFSPPRWNIGKRGATRVCYYYYLPRGTVVLLTVYDKSSKDDLTSDQLTAIRERIKLLETELRKQAGIQPS